MAYNLLNNGDASSSFPITIGVPQVYILAPTPFLIFINCLLTNTVTTHSSHGVISAMGVTGKGRFELACVLVGVDFVYPVLCPTLLNG